MSAVSTSRYRLWQSSGFTLIELLIVLLIIGILSGVTLRAIEMTRERTFYTDTTQKIFDLVKAIAGNPDLLADGKRVDFGFIGDMGRLPLALNELMHNTENSPNWHGPYIKINMLEDTLNPTYKTDAWGNEIQYDYTTGTLHSRGNGRQPLTYNITDSLSFLFNNKISGLITDDNNTPPGPRKDSTIDIIIQLPNRTSRRIPFASGAYKIDTVPIGKHPLWVIRNAVIKETLFKYVSVVPRSNTIVDFKFSKAFQPALKYYGGSSAAYGPDTANVRFKVYNDGADTLKISSMFFTRIRSHPPDTIAYCSNITAINESNHISTTLFSYPIPPNTLRRGEGDGVAFREGELTILPTDIFTFTLLDFYNKRNDDSVSLVHHVSMVNSDFQIKFGDGSIISFLAGKDTTQ
jgi:prepilin-type N-terminal cleavage/methylation domain-containing protein